jgi:TatD DNase family protein
MRLDAHVHLDLMRDPRQVAGDAGELGLWLLATTVSPEGYERALPLLSGMGNVRVAVGLHPWWVADGRCAQASVARAAELARKTRWVGEVGMDLSPHHVPEGSHDAQRSAFERVCSSAAEGSDPKAPTVLSIHSVRSAGECLDVLGETGALDRCRCVFHWFSGTSDELHRAVLAGCWFSVGLPMLRTRRGREYARQLPLKRLLTETDLPAEDQTGLSAGMVDGAILQTLAELSRIRGTDVTDAVGQNSEQLLSPIS